jgi:hypothetical protein
MSPPDNRKRSLPNTQRKGWLTPHAAALRGDVGGPIGFELARALPERVASLTMDNIAEIASRAG